MYILQYNTTTAYLIPPLQQLSVRIVEETTNVGTAETYPSQGLGKAHGYADSQVRPLSCVIPRPHHRVPLTASEVGPRQEEWPFVVVAFQQTLISREGMQQTVDVVYVPNNIFTY